MRTPKRLSGIALIMTLLLLVVLVVIVGQFSYSTQVDSYVAQNSSEDLQLRYALISALNFAIAQIQLDAMQEEGTQKKYDFLGDEWAREIWTPKNAQRIGTCSVYYTIQDENGKFNLLRLLEKREKEEKEQEEKEKEKEEENKKSKSIPPDEQFDLLVDAIQNKKEVVQASKLRESIVSWMKEKKGKSGNAEGPFPTKVPLFSMKELLMAKNVSSLVLFGASNKLDPEQSFQGLIDHATVWSDGKININTASQEVIKSLHSKIDDELAQRIVKYRQQEGTDGEKQCFKESADIKKVEGINEGGEGNKSLYPEIEDLITVKSSYFSIVATAQCGRIIKRLKSVVQRRGKRVYKLFCEYEE